jgi:hypothetical protein
MTIHRQWHLPLDPECEIVAEYSETLRDELASATGDALWAAFERLHRSECERCALYGQQNLAMYGPVRFRTMNVRA